MVAMSTRKSSANVGSMAWLCSLGLGPTRAASALPPHTAPGACVEPPTTMFGCSKSASARDAISLVLWGGASSARNAICLSSSPTVEASAVPCAWPTASDVGILAVSLAWQSCIAEDAERTSKRTCSNTEVCLACSHVLASISSRHATSTSERLLQRCSEKSWASRHSLRPLARLSASRCAFNLSSWCLSQHSSRPAAKPSTSRCVLRPTSRSSSKRSLRPAATTSVSRRVLSQSSRCSSRHSPTPLLKLSTSRRTLSSSTSCFSQHWLRLQDNPSTSRRSLSHSSWFSSRQSLSPLVKLSTSQRTFAASSWRCSSQS